MFNIITIGSATKDIFLDAKKLKKDNDFSFPLGEKIELEKILSFSGGGGVNTATTFALQGLKTAFCGILGQDLAGQEIIEELNQKGINTELVTIKPGGTTDIGLIFHAESERTILLYHGVSKTFSEKDIDWKGLGNTAWLYLAPLWKNAAKLTEKIVSSAKENNVKVALNPSLHQLSLPNIRDILREVNVLILNDEESAFLAGAKSYQEKKVFSEIRKITPAIIIITKGKGGAAALEGKSFYQITAPPTDVVDATGAGDSFGAGFVAGLIQKKTIKESLQLGMANAVSNIQIFGANKGLLKKGDDFSMIKITKTQL
jgi:sugar/nucleoside kinase (ribokinase family)